MMRLPVGILMLAAWFGLTLLNVLILPVKLAPVVSIVPVQKVSMELLVRAPGTLEPKESVTIKSEFEGPLVKKNFRAGQRVKKGDFLFEIGRDNIQVDYNGKRDSFVNARADLQRAEKDMKLQRLLFNKGAVARSTVDDAEQKLVKSRQSLRSAKETFDLVKRKWDQNRYVAPFDGTIVKDGIEGERFITAAKEVVTVADLTECFVKARVDELEISNVREGQVANVQVQAFEKTPLKAKVLQVGAQAEGTGLPEIPVLLRLEGTQNLPLRPKMTAEVRILTGRTAPTLVVPRTALSNADGQNRVWIVGVASRIRSQKVTIGQGNPDLVEVLSGVRENERVCKSADASFVEGMRVNLRE